MCQLNCLNLFLGTFKMECDMPPLQYMTNNVEEVLFPVLDELNAVSDSIHNNVEQYPDVQACAHLGSESCHVQLQGEASVLGRASLNVQSEQIAFNAKTDLPTIQCRGRGFRYNIVLTTFHGL